MEWSEVVAHARRSWTVVEEEPDWCGLFLDLDGRRQRVLVHRAAKGAAITLSAQVCAARHIQPRHALEYNGLSEPWALGLLRDAYILRRTIALASLTAAELAHAVEALSAEATRLHRGQVAVVTEAQHELRARLLMHWSEQ
jgi:hypothetical protein